MACKLVFHPHAQTHIEYEDQIEAFLEATDPELVSIVLDTGHHSYCGGDVVSFMRKHHARIPYLHLKSVDKALRTRVAAEGIPFAKAVGMGMFVEPSKGAVDFIAFRDLLARHRLSRLRHCRAGHVSGALRQAFADRQADAVLFARNRNGLNRRTH